ncbi:cytochrome c [Akkermansiaceae bacterium]|nr:cytochrome c [Akkermansiaceae bacterium]
MSPFRICLFTLLAVLPSFATPLPPNGFVESEQPFLRSALVVSEKPLNRVRRGVLLPLGNDLWTCFDPDLLRYAAIWKAPAGQAPLTMDSMAGISYPSGTAKADTPPKLMGRLIASSPELPGVGIRSLPDGDVRKADLLGGGGKVGPMPPGAGRYLGLALSGDRAALNYRIGGRLVREGNRSLGPDLIERMIVLFPGADPVAIGIDAGKGKAVMDGKKASLMVTSGDMPHLEIEGTSGYLLREDGKRGVTLLVPGGTKECVIRILRSSKPIASPPPMGKAAEFLPAAEPFQGEIKVAGEATPETGKQIAVRTLPLPEENPWKRRIRPTDIAFTQGGDALITTLDGDVWRVKNIGGKTSAWSRAASGIFEAMSIAVNAKGEVFVLGRDQITRLDDTDDDGFFDVHACASDAFNQTLHTRDYATSLELDADGSFIIARAGLIDSGKSKYGEMAEDRGSVLRISPNGLLVTKLADGLRVPYIGMAPGGVIFASDQQGNFIPSTPIHRIGKDVPYLGYEPSNFRKKRHPVPPLLWFPYQINRSGSSFATLSEEAFPSLGETFAHLSWSGRIFPIVTPGRGLPFAWKLPADFDFPILGAATNPRNGRLYAVGLGISGYKPETPRTAGLAEIRERAAIAAPVTLEISETSVIVGFRTPLPASFSLISPRPELDLWNIRRTEKYGSGHYRWNGEPGEHSVKTGKLTISNDRTKIAIEVPPIFRSDIMRLRLHLHDTATGDLPYTIEIYARPTHLPAAEKADLVAVGNREKSTAVAMVPGSAKTGETLFRNYGCTGCHALDGTKLTGPPLNGIASRHKGDIDAFLKTSIIDPAAVIAEGYEPSMPSFAGVIPEQDILHIVAYLKSLK